MKKLTAMLLIICMVVSLSACGGKTKDYAGTWVGEAGSVLILNKDKTFKYKDGGDKNAKTGKWDIKGKTLTVKEALDYDLYAELGESENTLLFEADDSSWNDEMFFRTK